jgi:hypothetical protein
MLTSLKINNQSVCIYNDNQSALVLANQTHQAFHVRMKHLNIKHHHICNTIAKGLIVIHYCLTKMMITNLLMKPLLQPQLAALKTCMQLID